MLQRWSGRHASLSQLLEDSQLCTEGTLPLTGLIPFMSNLKDISCCCQVFRRQNGVDHHQYLESADL